MRTTYLIDEDGIIIKAMDKVKAVDNPQEMLDMRIQGLSLSMMHLFLFLL